MSETDLVPPSDSRSGPVGARGLFLAPIAPVFSQGKRGRPRFVAGVGNPRERGRSRDSHEASIVRIASVELDPVLTSVAAPGKLRGNNDADSFSNPLILCRSAPVAGFPSRYAPL